MIKEHDRVVLRVDLSNEGLKTGDVGTVVHVHSGEKAYEVEFVTLDGHTEAVVTLRAADVRSVRKHEITHARELAIA
jgi:hypothetical protein